MLGALKSSLKRELAAPGGPGSSLRKEGSASPSSSRSLLESGAGKSSRDLLAAVATSAGLSPERAPRPGASAGLLTAFALEHVGDIHSEEAAYRLAAGVDMHRLDPAEAAAATAAAEAAEADLAARAAELALEEGLDSDEAREEVELRAGLSRMRDRQNPARAEEGRRLRLDRRKKDEAITRAQMKKAQARGRVVLAGANSEFRANPAILAHESEKLKRGSPPHEGRARAAAGGGNGSDADADDDDGSDGEDLEGEERAARAGGDQRVITRRSKKSTETGASAIGVSGETQFVAGGAMIAGFTYGVVKGGRFGRFVRRADDVLRELEAKEAEDRRRAEVQRLQDALTQEMADRVALVQRASVAITGELASIGNPRKPKSKTRASAKAAGTGTGSGAGAGTGGASGASGAAPPGLDPREWHVPPFRPACVTRPPAKAIAYHSICGDGEEIGNPGFWYGGRDKGTVVGLFGLRMRFGAIGGYRTGEESVSQGSESDEERYRPEPPKAAVSKVKEVNAARAEALRLQREDRRKRQAAAAKRRRRGEERAITMGVSVQSFERAGAGGANAEGRGRVIGGEDADVRRRRVAGIYEGAGEELAGAGVGSGASVAYASRSKEEWREQAEAAREDRAADFKMKREVSVRTVLSSLGGLFGGRAAAAGSITEKGANSRSTAFSGSSTSSRDTGDFDAGGPRAVKATKAGVTGGVLNSEANLEKNVKLVFDASTGDYYRLDKVETSYAAQLEAAKARAMAQPLGKDGYLRVHLAPIEDSGLDGAMDSFARDLKISEDAARYVDPAWLTLTHSTKLVMKGHRIKHFEEEERLRELVKAERERRARESGKADEDLTAEAAARELAEQRAKELAAKEAVRAARRAKRRAFKEAEARRKADEAAVELASAEAYARALQPRQPRPAARAEWPAGIYELLGEIGDARAEALPSLGRGEEVEEVDDDGVDEGSSDGGGGDGGDEADDEFAAVAAEFESSEDEDLGSGYVSRYTADPARAEADAADTPAWWAALGARDESVSADANAGDDAADRAARLADRAEALAAAGKRVEAAEASKAANAAAAQAAALADPSRRFRGFAGGALCAQNEDEYASRLARQEVGVRARLRRVITERELLETQIRTLTHELEQETAVWRPYPKPPAIEKLVKESIDALDAPLKREWELAFQQKVLKRKKDKDDAEIARQKRLGIYNAEEDRKRKELANQKRADEMLAGAAVTDELAEFRYVRKGEEFKSLGFLAIVAPDGSCIEWAGDGTQFLLSSWRARYRVKPWVVDAALLQFIASKQGSAVQSEADLAAALMAEGATAIIRAYKLGGEQLPLSGLELAKQQLVGRKQADAARLAADMAAKLEASRAMLERLAAERKLQQDEKRKRDDEQKRLDEIAANEDLQDKLRNAAAAARQLYGQVQKYMAEYQLRRNAALRQAVAVVRRDQTAALGILQGISALHFTYGVGQDADFATAQRKAFEKREPFFLKFNFNMGTLRDPAFLWYQRSDDIDTMISHLVWAPYQGNNATARLLTSKGYKYVTHATMLPQFALWSAVGTGRPITAMTITFDASRIKLMENKGFRQIEGEWRSDLMNPNAKFWWRAGRTRAVRTEADVDVVAKTEKDAIETKISVMEQRVQEAKDSLKKGQNPTQEQVAQIEALAVAKAAYAQKKSDELAAREQKMADAAVEFMGIPAEELEELKSVYNEMDEDRSGAVDMGEFFKFVEITRTPIADSIFYFLDANFNEQISFGTFLRTACTFCMFGSKEMVTWVFSIVAANTVGKAETRIALANVGKPPAPGPQGVSNFDPKRPGAWGIDRRNAAVYWDDAVAWSGLQTSDTQGKISTLAFRQLLYNIHPPTSAMATTVKVAIARSEKLCIGGQMRLFQFRQLVAEFPTLLSPIFLMQSYMRKKFLGEDWWAEKRELFDQAREIVQGQIAAEVKDKMAKREADRKKRAADKAAADALARAKLGQAAAASAAVGAGGGNARGVNSNLAAVAAAK